MVHEKTGFGVTGLALVLNIIGVAIPYWYYFTYTYHGNIWSGHFGLWKVCLTRPVDSGSAVTVCQDLDQLKSFIVSSGFKFARALEILAILITAVAILLVVMKTFFMKKNIRLLHVTWPIIFCAGLFALIGAIVFIVDNDARKSIEGNVVLITDHLHAVFGLCIVSGILCFVASLMFFLSARK